MLMLGRVNKKKRSVFELKFDFDKKVDRRGTYSKWDIKAYLIREGIATKFDDETIPLFTADMDFECAPCIKQAIMKVAEHNVYGYTMLDESNRLPYAEAVVSWFKRRHGWSFAAENVCYVEGTMEGVGTAVQTFTEPGEGVLLTLPIYTPFMGTVKGTGRKIVNSQLHNENGYYTFDFEDFEKKASDPSVKAFLLCNPHNPTGRVWTTEELKRIHEICRKHGVIIISDELHGDIVRKSVQFHPIAKVTDGKGVITCTGLGKTFNIAALHPSHVIITDEELLEKFKAAVPYELPSPFTIAAIIAAYTHGDEWVDAVNEYLERNIDWACQFIKEHLPKVVMTRPEGTYILWMDFRGYGLDPKEVSYRISEGANVLLEHGEQFDPEFGPGFERLCTPTRRALLEEALKRIAAQF